MSDKYNFGRRNSAYEPSQCDRLIDPRSGLALSYRDSMRRLYYECINRLDLKKVTTKRITMLQTSEVDEFIPNNYILSVNDLVAHIKRIGVFREQVRGIYHNAMDNQRLASEENRTTSDDAQTNNRTSRFSTTLASTTPNNPTTNAVVTSNNNSPSRNHVSSVQNDHSSSTVDAPVSSSTAPHHSDSDSFDFIQFTTRRFQNRNVLNNLSTSTD